MSANQESDTNARRALWERAVVVIALLFVGGIVAVFWRMHVDHRTTVRDMAVNEARARTVALAEFRTLYSSEVVEAITARGGVVTHDYREQAGAIPLPATMTLLLGERLSAPGGVESCRLYSPHPFPWRRSTGGLRDEFARDAWEVLGRDPGEAFYRFETVGGRPLLRYATADSMRSSCVECHNSHPQTPKNDWKQGDLRGVLEVDVPLDSVAANLEMALTRNVLLLVLVTVLGLVGLGIAFQGLRLRTAEALLAAESMRDANRRLSNEIEERERTEERLRHSQKLEAVGSLAGGVAHDFNNLLMVIKGNVELLESVADESAELADINEATDRAAALIRQLLAFSSRQELRTEVLGLNALVGTSSRLLERLIGEHITIVRSLAADLWNVKADPGQIEQVVMNLALNARDAMPDGGTLTFRTANVGEVESASERTQGIPAADWVVLEVEDSGCGMDSETQNRIFEPFFTTKKAGTGLGLSTVYGIMQQSGGHILVDSEPGRGTRMRIFLAAVEDGVDVPRAVPRLERARHSATILVVEDECSLRDLFRSMLEADGHSVLTAGDGVQAIRVAKLHEGAIHILLSDVVLPGVDGLETAARIRELRPGVGVIYMTGYEKGLQARCGASEPDVSLLRKPFSQADLRREVAKALSRVSGSAASSVEEASE